MGNTGRGVYSFEGFTLDLTGGCVRKANREIELRAKSFELLAYLVTNAGRLVSKDELATAVWPSVIVSDDSLVQCVSDVRQALNDADRHIVKTVPRRGYIFAAPVAVRTWDPPIAQFVATSSEIEDQGDGLGAGSAPRPLPLSQTGSPGRAQSAAITSTSLGIARPRPDLLYRGLAQRHAALAVGAVVAICLGVAILWGWPHTDGSVPSILAPAASSPQIAPPPKSSRAPLSLVVLPFTNLSSDPDQEFFADGITDDLTTDLSRMADSLVIARNTAFTYKGKAVSAKQIGRDLGVRYVVEGSVRRGGDRILVNVQLVDAETGAHAWADRFETDRRSLAEAQSEITGRLARMLNVELVSNSGRRIELERAVDPDARDLVMRAWARYYRPFSPASVQEALQDFERALEMDPRSVDARIGIATILLGRISVAWSSSERQDQARAAQLLLEALESDTNRSSAHVAMGVLRRIQLRFSESKMEFETAIALDRNNARAIFQLGQTMMWLGEPEAGIPLLEKAIRLNPYDPTLASHYGVLGLCNLFLGHVEEAIDLIRKARAANPRFYTYHLWLAGALGFQGDLDEARAALAESLNLKPEINSFAAQRANAPWIANPPHWALREKTLNVGLRRIGFPEESISAVR
jgi:TolB-like protein/DNA-binding winged helix-turn-helix (wHTH) protein/tetratricopeptide (TPR) repeat protein